MPEDMPEHMPEDMPDRMPDRMPEDMSDRMPEDLPVRKCINVMVGITRSKVIYYLLFTYLLIYLYIFSLFDYLIVELVTYMRSKTKGDKYMTAKNISET
jgi:hypothetical protein